jgi:hypothetical protein
LRSYAGNPRSRKRAQLERCDGTGLTPIIFNLDPNRRVTYISLQIWGAHLFWAIEMWSTGLLRRQTETKMENDLAPSTLFHEGT